MKHDSFKARLYLLAFAIVFLLLLFVYLNALEADETESRPRYTLIDVRFSFLFSNSDTLPFTLIRQMCWNDSVGFCDDGLAGAEEIYFLVDWNPENPVYGAIFETDSGTCFWWSYQPEWGADGNPHVAQAYWVECPVLALN
jgi:hypothetical protein